MRAPLLAFILGIILVVPAAFAYERGDVLLEDATYIAPLDNSVPSTWELWQFSPRWQISYAIAGGDLLINKTIPYVGPGQFIATKPSEFVFRYDNNKVALWDGQPHSMMEPGSGFVDIFQADEQLGAFAPLRSGSYLVAANAKLIEFNLHGRIADHPIADGPGGFDVLADQCTVLYAAAGNKVRRTNICTGQAMSDFATLLPGENAGAIRVLPNGDVLVADAVAILRFNAAGSLIASYEFPGVTHIAVSSDGRSFYAAGVSAMHLEFRLYAFDGTYKTIAIGNPEMNSIEVPAYVSDLVVVGEWRAATAVPARFRAVRH